MSADAWSVCPRCTARNDIGYRTNEFREDYEIYGAETGTITVDYRGKCERCGLLLEFTTKHEIPDWRPVETNQPQTDKARTLTWAEVPAGWFVQTPRGDWLEVTRTAQIGAHQRVGLLINGDEASFPRNSQDTVTAAPGTSGKPLTDALNALKAGGINIDVIEDGLG